MTYLPFVRADGSTSHVRLLADRPTPRSEFVFWRALATLPRSDEERRQVEAVLGEISARPLFNGWAIYWAKPE